MRLLIPQLCVVALLLAANLVEGYDDGQEAEVSVEPENVPASEKSPAKLIPIESHHPLDPLDAFELKMAATIVRLYNSSSPWAFEFIGLREPDKTTLYPYFLTQSNPPQGLIPRRANVEICDPIIRRPIWVIVNLSTFQVESWQESPPGSKVTGQQLETNALAGRIIFSDPNILARLNAQGYTGQGDVVTDIWEAGYLKDNPSYDQSAKILQVFLYGYKAGGDSNYWAYPFDFVVYVDVGAQVIRGIEDMPLRSGFDTSNRSGNSVPTSGSEYFPNYLPPNTLRTDLHPIKITQPDGPSFQINGRQITWQNFQLRVGYNRKEGPHFYTVSFNDAGTIRPIAYRMSITEVYLQYGDPRPPGHRKSQHDVSFGELGSNAFDQPVHQFCRGDAAYLPAEQHNEAADTWIVQNAICVVEEDAGVLWSQRNPITNNTAVTRSQRLSINHMSSIGITLYYMQWRFYQDATIELAIKITGVLSGNLMAVDVKSPPPYGNLVADQVFSQIYQHFFAVRIDADIDGRNNTVAIEDIVRVSDLDGPENPYGNGMTTTSTVLKTPGEAASDTVPTRSWKIFNSNKIQEINSQPVSYKLTGHGFSSNFPNMLALDSPLRKTEIPWADHSTWVLPYNPYQIFAGGRDETDGVSVWTQENLNASLENVDVVLWHVANYIWYPEIEDWPILSTLPEIGIFRMHPSSFFNINPSIDVPPASESTRYDGRENDNSGWSSKPVLPGLPPRPSGGWTSSKNRIG